MDFSLIKYIHFIKN